MDIELTGQAGNFIAIISGNGIIINTVDDALDIIGNSSYRGAHKVIVNEENIHPAFFDLKTGIAGEILQKFSTYQTHLAIIGDFSKYTSKSLRDFIYESNKAGRIIFVTTVEEAITKLSAQ